jgi:hypothetical protein
VSSINKAGGLAAIDSLRLSAMEEGVLDVKLMDCPVPGEGKGEDGVNGCDLTMGLKVSS